MAICPESIEEFLHLVPNLLEDEGWQICHECPAGKLLKQSCPWGGHLVKLSCQNIPVSNLGERSPLFVRPEARNRMLPELNEERYEVVKQLGAGDALIMRNGDVYTRFFKLCNVFFSLKHKDDASLAFLFPTGNEIVHNVVRHNYVEIGDSVLFGRNHTRTYTGFAHARRQKEPGLVSISLTLTARTVANWVSVPFQSVITSARALMDWYVNRPGMEEMRRLDEQFYVVLTIHSWSRGRPFLPVLETAEDIEDVTTIDAGRRQGLAFWGRYHPRMVGSSSFALSEYLMLFLQKLGEHVDMYQSLEGKELQHYQCVVPQHEWQRVKDRFYTAYNLQKSAYRRANGGQAAPGMSEHAEPRFRTDRGLRLPQLYRPVLTPRAPALVVHNTFLELEEPEDLGTGEFERTRSRSASPRSFHNKLVLAI
ncbi:Kcnc2 [Symbiodinium microadriaticum]|nr:Kcnc2 [Symbiodinium microadriaticum]CAE7880079.1 Kcnc2 [Symbiodinium sp. KB8]